MKILNPEVTQALAAGKKIRLNIGGGATKKEGYYNIDIVELPEVDIVANLNEPLTLLPDNSVDAVYTCHVLEHVSNLLGLMEELHRVCAPDAELEIIVPHFSSPLYYSDPTHVRPWGIYTIAYFMDKEDQVGRKVPCYYTKARFKLVSRRIVFARTNLLDRLFVPLLRGVLNRWFAAMEVYERRWAWIYPAWELQMRIKPKK